MISNPQEMRALSQELTNSAWTLAAIGALFESGLVEHLREPRSADDLSARCPGLSKGRIERSQTEHEWIVRSLEARNSEEAAAALARVPEELRLGPQQGEPTKWIADPIRLLRVCDVAVRRLVALPAGTPSPTRLSTSMVSVRKSTGPGG